MERNARHQRALPAAVAVSGACALRWAPQACYENWTRGSRGIRDAQGCACTAPRPVRARTQVRIAHAHTHYPHAHEAGCALLTPTPVCHARLSALDSNPQNSLPTIRCRTLQTTLQAHARQAHACRMCACTCVCAFVCAVARVRMPNRVSTSVCLISLSISKRVWACLRFEQDTVRSKQDSDRQCCVLGLDGSVAGERMPP